ncbi:hypothetical protein [Ramlibacter sp. WS9]|uniref:hypothetical protein n=1 Tax=Ramlibacter sp. WS9 TaxID=1882741 RepID=UPI0011416721|nr:hypothetical protein [Ramlibacter sp. WS9]
MNESTLGSVLAMLVVATLAYFIARWLCIVVRGKYAWILFVLAFIATALSIFTVDVNVPLSRSHFRPSGDPAPPWVALLAWLFRILPLFVLVVDQLLPSWRKRFEKTRR